jgi:hypothetical protein
LTVPNAQIVAPPTSDQSKKLKQRDPSTYYHKSPFFKSTDDPAIQEQLRTAFSDRPDGIPDRDVYLVQEAEPLKSLVIRFSNGSVGCLVGSVVTNGAQSDGIESQGIIAVT